MLFCFVLTAMQTANHLSILTSWLMAKGYTCHFLSSIFCVTWNVSQSQLKHHYKNLKHSNLHSNLIEWSAAQRPFRGLSQIPFLFSLDTSGYRCRAEIFQCWVYCVGREDCVDCGEKQTKNITLRLELLFLFVFTWRVECYLRGFMTFSVLFLSLFD